MVTLPSNVTDFESLVEAIRNTLGPDAGITSEDVEVSDLIHLMQQYQSDESQWEKYAFADLSRSYTRNLVDEGNGNANLLVLVWSPGQGSVVHDHANAHCIMKVLKGKLVESLYEMPDRLPSDEKSTKERPLKLKRETVFEKNSVAYISDQIGLHKVQNADPNEVAVSLHLYTPPYASKDGCYLYDSRTSKRIKINLCDYYSVRGEKNVKKGQAAEAVPSKCL